MTSSPGRINLALVDDHNLYRKVLSEHLTMSNRVNVLIQVATAEELFQSFNISKVDVIILDYFMPKIAGLEVLHWLRQHHSSKRVVVLSMCQDLSIISVLLEHGINAYLSKNDEPDDLLEAIIAVSENRIYRNSWFTNALFFTKENKIGSSREKAKRSLTEREKKIIQLLWEEKTNTEIANQIYLSTRSVEKIRQDIKEKIDYKSIAGLFRYALEAGIISMLPGLI